MIGDGAMGDDGGIVDLMDSWAMIVISEQRFL